MSLGSAVFNKESFDASRPESILIRERIKEYEERKKDDCPDPNWDKLVQLVNEDKEKNPATIAISMILPKEDRSKVVHATYHGRVDNPPRITIVIRNTLPLFLYKNNGDIGVDSPSVIITQTFFRVMQQMIDSHR